MIYIFTNIYDHIRSGKFYLYLINNTYINVQRVFNEFSLAVICDFFLSDVLRTQTRKNWNSKRAKASLFPFRFIHEGVLTQLRKTVRETTTSRTSNGYFGPAPIRLAPRIFIVWPNLSKKRERGDARQMEKESVTAYLSRLFVFRERRHAAGIRFRHFASARQRRN